MKGAVAGFVVGLLVAVSGGGVAAWSPIPGTVRVEMVDMGPDEQCVREALRVWEPHQLFAADPTTRDEIDAQWWLVGCRWMRGAP